MPTDVISTTVSNDGVQLFSTVTTLVDNSRFLYNPVGGVPTGTTSLLFDAAFTLAHLISLEMTCDQVVNIYTNAADGTGGNHFAWVAGESLLWHAGSLATNPLTHDVTAIYINNASGEAANLKISILVHSA